MLMLQIVYPDGTVAKFPAGGPIETDLIELITKEIMSRGVRYRSNSHIEKDIREGAREAILNFKKITLHGFKKE